MKVGQTQIFDQFWAYSFPNFDDLINFLCQHKA